MWAPPEPCDGAWERTEQWVWRHSGVQLDYEPLGQLEGSCDSRTLSSHDEHCLLSLCDSSDTMSPREEPACSPSGVDTNSGALPQAREQPLRMERRMGTRSILGAQQPGRREAVNKVARPPWKTSADVNPVYCSKSIFGRLMGGIQDRAAATGVISDAVDRDNIACF